eukprot:UN05149
MRRRLANAHTVFSTIARPTKQLCYIVCLTVIHSLFFRF